MSSQSYSRTTKESVVASKMEQRESTAVVCAVVSKVPDLIPQQIPFSVEFACSPLSMPGFSPATPASSHSLKTSSSGQLVTLSCL